MSLDELVSKYIFSAEKAIVELQITESFVGVSKTEICKIKIFIWLSITN